MRMEQRLKQKYRNRDVDTFRAIPNELTARKEREALTEQLEEFNNFKIIPASNPEQSEHLEDLNSPLKHSHQSAA
jgi:hypothetical protein